MDPSTSVDTFTRRLSIQSLLSRIDGSTALSGDRVTLGGRVMVGPLELCGVVYIKLNDGSCCRDVEVYFDLEVVKLPHIDFLAPGATIYAKTVLRSVGRVMQVKAVEVLHVGSATLNLNMSTTRKIDAVDRVRSGLYNATTTFFEERNFTHVNTPIINEIDFETAVEKFQVTTLISKLEKELKANEEEIQAAHCAVQEKGAIVIQLKDAKASQEDIAAATTVLKQAQDDLINLEERGKFKPEFPHKDGKIDYSSDYLSKKAFLTVSGQPYLESYACSLSKAYTFGPTFRAENSHTVESWMLQPEFAFADINDCMDCAEAYVKSMCASLLKKCLPDLKFLDNECLNRLRMVASATFERITYNNAIKLLKESRFRTKVKWGNDLANEHERYLTEMLEKPVIVYNYPKGIKAFHMRLNEDGETVAAMDVLVPKVGKLIEGGQREERLGFIEERITALGLSLDSYKWYLDLRRFGTIEHVGWGLLFQKLLIFTTGIDNIKDLIRFPRMSPNDPSRISSDLSLYQPIIRNQRQKPWCVIFAAISWYERMDYLQTKIWRPLSVQQWIDGFPGDMDDGIYITEFLKYLDGFQSVTTKENYPTAKNYNKGVFDYSKAKKQPQVGFKWIQLRNRTTETYVAAMEKKLKNSPLLGQIMAPVTAVRNYDKGILRDPPKSDEILVGHALVILDHGTSDDGDYWVVQNSHGRSWGEDGVGKIAKGCNYCGIENTAYYLVPLTKTQRNSKGKKSDKYAQGLPNMGSNAAAGLLDFLCNSPQFQALRTMVQSNDSNLQILQPVLQELGKRNPQLMRFIQEHEADFLCLINKPGAGGYGEGNLISQLVSSMPQQVSLTPEERGTIEHLEAQGFRREEVLQVYFACNEIEELALQYLSDDHMDELDEDEEMS